MAIGKADVAYKPKRDKIGPVPVLDDDVFVRRLNVAERNEWSRPRLEAAMAEDGERFDAFAKVMKARILVAFYACVTESGEQLFDSVAQVEAWPPDAVDFIASEVERLNGLTKEAADDIAGN